MTEGREDIEEENALGGLVRWSRGQFRVQVGDNPRKKQSGRKCEAKNFNLFGRRCIWRSRRRADQHTSFSRCVLGATIKFSTWRIQSGRSDGTRVGRT